MFSSVTTMSAFLIAIVIWHAVGPVIKIVTAFTVAHSITLSLAALPLWSFPALLWSRRLASIVYVAIENFFSCNVDGRWRDTFAFGLVFSFFRPARVPAYRGARLSGAGCVQYRGRGGPLAIVRLVIPVLIGVDWLIAWMRGAVPHGGACLRHLRIIACLGCYWFLERTVLGA